MGFHLKHVHFIIFITVPKTPIPTTTTPSPTTTTLTTKPTSQNTVIIIRASTPKKKVTHDHKIVKPIIAGPTPTTPCPTVKCNCTKGNATDGIYLFVHL